MIEITVKKEVGAPVIAEAQLINPAHVERLVPGKAGQTIVHFVSGKSLVVAGDIGAIREQLTAQSAPLYAGNVDFTGDPERIEAVTEEALANGTVTLPDDATATELPDGNVVVNLPHKTKPKK